MDLLEENTEKSCLLTPERIQHLSPVAANLITLEVSDLFICEPIPRLGLYRSFAPEICRIYVSQTNL